MLEQRAVGFRIVRHAEVFARLERNVSAIQAAARARGVDLTGKTPKQIMNMWMMWAWQRTEAIARNQLELEQLATVRAEIDAQLGRLG
jgi:hypothetical protein